MPLGWSCEKFTLTRNVFDYYVYASELHGTIVITKGIGELLSYGKVCKDFVKLLYGKVCKVCKDWVHWMVNNFLCLSS